MEQEQDGDISIPHDEELGSLEVKEESQNSPIDRAKLEADGGADIGERTEIDNAESDRALPEEGDEDGEQADDLASIVEDISLDDDRREMIADSPQSDKQDAPEHSIPRIYAQYDEHDPTRSPVSHMHNDSNASSRHISEAEDAGLDFVDINLGPSHNASPYGAGAHFASRSAIEIRQDSISSESTKAKELARMQEAMQRASTSSNTSSSQQGDIASTESNAVDVEREEHLSTPKPAGITMTLANEDGDVESVTSPTTERVAVSPADEAKEEGSDAESSKPEGIVEEDAKANGSTEAASVPEEGIADRAVVDLGSASLPTSPSLTDAADREPQGKRKESNRPSALEQHRSRTRMTNLPPKPKVEDTKHLHDFETMMRLSREMDQKRQQEEEERKNKRDASLQERMKVWEKEILPSWTRARRETRLRKLWWKGVPPNLRGRIWALACGNSQMLPRNLYSKTSAEATEARQAGTFNKVDVAAIDADIEETLPSLRLFQKDSGALHEDLRDVLSAFTKVRADQQRAQTASSSSNQGDDEASAVYPVGVASLGAMLLLNLSPSETLIALINLIAERPWLRALYSLSATHEARERRMIQRRASHAGTDSKLSALHSTLSTRASMSAAAHRPYDSSGALAGFERVFDTLLADQMPKVYANMQAHGVRPSAYVNDWIRTLFVPYLPFDAVARLWDCILLEEKDALLFRTGIALVSLLSARLYVPDREELVSILHGNNRAAIAVWTRVRTNGVESLASDKQENGTEEEQEPASARSAVFAPDELVPRDDVYGGQYGVTERTLFDALEEQEAWWKDSVLERLLDREIVS
jgi:hypothetical protein